MPLLYLYPDGLDSNAWTGTFADVDDPHDAPDDFLTLIQWNSVADSEARFTLTAMPAVASILSITLKIRGVVSATTPTNGQIRGLLRISSTNYFDTYVNGSGAWMYQSATRTTNPATGTEWTVSDLNALIAGVSAKTTGGVDYIHCSQIVIVVDAVSLPVKLGAARHRGSAEIHLRRSALPTITGRFGLLALDRQLLDLAAWQHYAGPTVKDDGWGIRPWQRRLGALVASDFDMDALEVTQTDLDLRRFLVSFRDTMSSEEVPSPEAQGVLRLDPGAGRIFVRATKAWIDNPAAALQGIQQVVRVEEGAEKITASGTLIEPARTDSLFRSSMKDGLTGLTAVGTAGQSTADTTDLLFEAAESGNSLKITRNGTAEDQGRTWPATAAFAANDRVVWSIDHRNDSGVAVSAYLQRSSDSKYYRDSDNSWQTGIQYNALPLSGASTIARWVSKVIDVGTGTPTLTASIVHRSADANGTISHAYHNQIELGRSATSRIITQAAAVTRNKDELKIENFTGKVVYDPARGTGYVECVPNFNSADLAAGSNQTLLRAYKDASNFDGLRYSKDNGAFEFLRVLGGVTYTASKVQVLTRGTTYKIGFRATGTDAEEDLTAYTVSVFVDGVKGTDAVPAGTWTPAAAEYLYIGQRQDGADQWDGALRQLIIRPFVFSDAEMVDQP